MIEEITKRLYSHTPTETLYHYTNFTGLAGIVESQSLWASDIRYMNDSAELKHTVDLIKQEVTRRISRGSSFTNILNQFVDWVSKRITNGHILFGGSFRSNGNLLSQWRGYSAMGKGVSLGFHPDHIITCAEQQRFQVGRCIYEPEQQQQLIAQVIDVVEQLSSNCHTRRADIDYVDTFSQVESDLLRIAAILKHPSFREEEEWRVVSPVVTDYLHSPIKFREGTSMLVPYIEFELSIAPDQPVPIEHIFLGPTPNIELSMNSLQMYLATRATSPLHGIDYCQIPYRQR